jgi:hypothetical protein
MLKDRAGPNGGARVLLHDLVERQVDCGDHVHLVARRCRLDGFGGRVVLDRVGIHPRERIGRVLCTLGDLYRLGYLRRDLGFYAFLGLLIEEPLLDQILLENADRVASPPALHFLGGSVQLVVVVGRVGVVAVGVGLDERRAPTGARPLDGLRSAAVHLEDVVAVDTLGRHSVGRRPFRQASRHLLGDRNRDGVLVVLDDENHREAADYRKVERLVEVALRRGALAAPDHAHGGFAAAL